MQLIREIGKCFRGQGARRVLGSLPELKAQGVNSFALANMQCELAHEIKITMMQCTALKKSKLDYYALINRIEGLPEKINKLIEISGARCNALTYLVGNKRDIALDVVGLCYKYNITISSFMQPHGGDIDRTCKKHFIIWQLVNKMGYSQAAVTKFTDRDHTTIHNSLNRIEMFFCTKDKVLLRIIEKYGYYGE